MAGRADAVWFHQKAEGRLGTTTLGRQEQQLAFIDQVDIVDGWICLSDAGLQRNALKMSDPKQAKDLTRQEREEVFRRSLKTMGLKEDGPM